MDDKLFRSLFGLDFLSSHTHMNYTTHYGSISDSLPSAVPVLPFVVFLYLIRSFPTHISFLSIFPKASFTHEILPKTPQHRNRNSFYPLSTSTVLFVFSSTPSLPSFLLSIITIIFVFLVVRRFHFTFAWRFSAHPSSPIVCNASGFGCTHTHFKEIYICRYYSKFAAFYFFRHTWWWTDRLCVL